MLSIVAFANNAVCSGSGKNWREIAQFIAWKRSNSAGAWVEKELMEKRSPPAGSACNTFSNLLKIESEWKHNTPAKQINASLSRRQGCDEMEGR